MPWVVDVLLFLHQFHMQLKLSNIMPVFLKEFNNPEEFKYNFAAHWK
jgi:hypothetical protein